jgi:molybdopterin molybdotransferase
MPEFLNLIPPKEALEFFLSSFHSQTNTEVIPVEDGLERIIREEICAPHPLPQFERSTVDGYALRASDTFGASESLPIYLKQIGEIQMGNQPPFIVNQGECALIHTGGMIPQEADAVIMVENTQGYLEGEIEILRAVAVGENIIHIGEDIKDNEIVFSPGLTINPAVIGGLMAIGSTQITVSCRPKIGIISYGDEIIAPHKNPEIGQVRDINGYTLQALVENSGGEPIYFGITPDSYNDLLDVVSAAKESCDLVVITAGSSASTRDLTSVVLNQLGDPGVLVHGVNIRPGKPTILAVCEGKPMIGLPGNPVSALVVAGLFVVPVIKKLLGCREKKFQNFVHAKLTINLASIAGREDWVPVTIAKHNECFEAIPIFGKSNLIFSLVKADGLVKIPSSKTGFSVGDSVKVFLI